MAALFLNINGFFLDKPRKWDVEYLARLNTNDRLSSDMILVNDQLFKVEKVRVFFYSFLTYLLD